MRHAGRSFGSLFLLLVILTGSDLKGQTLSPKMEVFSPEDYGGHRQVFCAEAFPDGRLAFGTSSKLLILDGKEFEDLELGSGKVIMSMDLDDRNRLFIGGRSLMGVVTPSRKGEWGFHSLHPLLPDSLKDHGMIWDTWCGPSGDVYFKASQYVFQYDGDSMRTVRPENEVVRMHKPNKHPVYQDLENGLVRLKKGKKELMPDKDSIFDDRSDLMSILPAPGTEKWDWTVFTQSVGIYRYDTATGRSKEMPDGQGDPSLSSIFRGEIYTAVRMDPSKNVYDASYVIGTKRRGVFFLSDSGRVLAHMGRGQGLPADLIWDLETDEWGNVWVGTNNGLALLHTGLPFTETKEGGLFEGSVNDLHKPSIPQKKGGGLLLATSQGGWKWNANEHVFERIENTTGQAFEVFSLSEEANGELMGVIGNGHHGVVEFPLSSSSKISPHRLSKFHTYSIEKIDRLRGHSLLLAGRDGLGILTPFGEDPGEYEITFTYSEVPAPIRDIEYEHGVGSNNDSIRIWMEMGAEGVAALTIDTAVSAHRFSTYDTASGLPEGWVRLLRDPKSERVIFGSEKGLMEFRDGGFHPCSVLGKAFRKGSSKVRALEKGGGDELFVNDRTGGQISHLVPENEGAGYRVDSIPFRALNIGTIGSMFADGKKLWLGGGQGVACYYPRTERNYGKSWHCRIQKVLGAEDSLLFAGNFWETTGMGLNIGKDTLDRYPVREQPEALEPQLPFSKGRVKFVFRAMFPLRQSEIEYRHRLVGFDTTWSKWTSENQKEYTSLPEGSYTFKVKARNVFLNESRVATYRFRVFPPWYRTWVAYGGYTIAGMGLLWLLLWLNGKRLIAQKRRLEKIVDDRTKEIQSKNRALEKEKEKVEEQKEKIEEAHHEITQSIEYAQKIQDALLRSEAYFSSHWPDHFILFKPQATVSGDFYWAREHQGYLYFAAVDCTGHGVPGAFMSMLGLSQLNEIMNTNELLTPGAILTELRERVVRELTATDADSSAKDGMDAAMVRIPLDEAMKREEGSDGENGRRRIQFAGANNPLYIIGEGVTKKDQKPTQDTLKGFRNSDHGLEVKGDKMAVGYEPGSKGSFLTTELNVEKGDMLYMFSDGYADQFGGSKGKKFRYGPFKEVLVRIHHDPVEEQKAELDRVFLEWKGDQEQIDDVCVIGIRV